MGLESKRCTKCGIEKVWDEFYICSRNKDGYDYWCIACRRAYDGPRKFLIYGLFDPFTKELRYVGKTEGTLKKRLREHISTARTLKTNDHRKQWILSVLKKGDKPEIGELEELFSHEELVEAEEFWIAYYKSVGCRLVNATGGGEGAKGYRHSPEVRRQMSDAKKAHPSRHMKGKKHSIETRLAVSSTKTGLCRDQQEQIVKLYKQGLNSYAVGAKFGVSSTCVLGLLKIFGIAPRNISESRRRFSDEQELEIVKLYEQGDSAPTIALRFACSERGVGGILERRGVTLRSMSDAMKNRWKTLGRRRAGNE